ncbi:MAG TPA: Ig-like domain-containing protein, partial [Zeimonas sp.]|nr:Ig-like domain-containing protein [Zeimonas sp.]
AGADSAAPVAGDTVRLSSGATLVGTAVLNASNISAGFVDITTTPLGADGSKTLTATVTDAANNVSDPSGALAITIDRTAPAAPTVNPQVTNDTTPAITGTAVVGAGETLTVTVNGVTYSVGADLVRSGNDWTLTVPAALPQGTYNVVATVTDAAGNASSDATSNELVVDTTPPGTPTIALVAGDDRVNASEAGAGVAVVGTAEASSTVTVTWGSSQEVVTADGAGNWSTSFSTVPADGPATTISARAQDAAGNAGPTGSRVVEIDTVAPTANVQSALVLDDDPGPAVGVPSGGTTDDTTPTLQLTLNELLASGEDLRVYRDGVAVGVATSSGTTVYAYADGPLLAGPYVYTADIVDRAGNVSTLDLDVSTLALNYAITVI